MRGAWGHSCCVRGDRATRCSCTPLRPWRALPLSRAPPAREPERGRRAPLFPQKCSLLLSPSPAHAALLLPPSLPFPHAPVVCSLGGRAVVQVGGQVAGLCSDACHAVHGERIVAPDDCIPEVDSMVQQSASIGRDVVVQGGASAHDLAHGWDGRNVQRCARQQAHCLQSGQAVLCCHADQRA